MAGGKQVVRRAIAAAIHHSGLLSAAFVRRQHGTAVVVMYHRVNDDHDPFFPGLPTAMFERQVAFLAQTYRMETISDLQRWLAAGAPGPARAAVTIDDGTVDTHSVALPILRAHGVPATLFLATAPPELGEPLWLDRLRHLLKRTPQVVLQSTSLGLGPLSLASIEDRLHALRLLSSRLKAGDATVVTEAMDELSDSLGGTALGAGPATLTWDQVREMSDAGIEIGAHTHRHYIASRLAASDCWAEIQTSADLIRRRVGVEVGSFAYPNGTPQDYTPETKAILAAMGFRVAVSTRYGFATPQDDPLDLPRLYSATGTLSQFACRMAGLGSSARPGNAASAASRTAPNGGVA